MAKEEMIDFIVDTLGMTVVHKLMMQKTWSETDVQITYNIVKHDAEKGIIAA